MTEYIQLLSRMTDAGRELFNRTLEENSSHLVAPMLFQFRPEGEKKKYQFPNSDLSRALHDKHWGKAADIQLTEGEWYHVLCVQDLNAKGGARSKEVLILVEHWLEGQVDVKSLGYRSAMLQGLAEKGEYAGFCEKTLTPPAVDEAAMAAAQRESAAAYARQQEAQAEKVRAALAPKLPEPEFVEVGSDIEDEFRQLLDDFEVGLEQSRQTWLAQRAVLTRLWELL